jgi:peroxiredoxin
MEQIVDLQSDDQFQGLNVQLVNINMDSVPLQEQQAQYWGIPTPMLADEDLTVSGQYGVLRWGMANGEPGHTFVLVGKDGLVKGIKDYGGRENGMLMYVEPSRIYRDIAPWVRQQ